MHTWLPALLAIGAAMLVALGTVIRHRASVQPRTALGLWWVGAVVAFADRRNGVGLYAFVEADRSELEVRLRSTLAAASDPKPPEHIQIVSRLPRDADGRVRTEILQLIAMNQIDLIEPLMKSPADREFFSGILESRKNLRDRFNFGTADQA